MKVSTLNKILGQHFLINKTAIKKIIAALDLKPNDTIIEIGPGKGALTLPLAEECQKIGCKIIAIEKDPLLVERLRVKGERKNLKIISGDILKILSKVHNKSLVKFDQVLNFQMVFQIQRTILQVHLKQTEKLFHKKWWKIFDHNFHQF